MCAAQTSIEVMWVQKASSEAYRHFSVSVLASFVVEMRTGLFETSICVEQEKSGNAAFLNHPQSFIAIAIGNCLPMRSGELMETPNSPLWIAFSILK
jgi:hypothetical protein